MKKLLVAGFLLCAGCCVNVYGDEGWGPSVYRAQLVNQQAPVVQNFQNIHYYYYAPGVTIAPAVHYFVPVTVYQNILVERRYTCFFKRIEVVSAPQTLYVPIKY
jgi:hypothetical protein